MSSRGAGRHPQIRLPGEIGPQGQIRIQIAVFYKNKERHGSYTPRQAIYELQGSGLAAIPRSPGAYAQSGSYIYGTPNYNFIKLIKGKFHLLVLV